MSIPSRTEAQNAIEHDVTDDDAEKEQDFPLAEQTRIEIDGRKQFFNLQKRWSTAIMVWISGLIIFNAMLTIMFGLGCLDFSASPWFITAVTVETFLQVVGLGYVAARYLFSNDRNPSR